VTRWRCFGLSPVDDSNGSNEGETISVDQDREDLTVAGYDGPWFGRHKPLASRSGAVRQQKIIKEVQQGLHAGRRAAAE